MKKNIIIIFILTLILCACGPNQKAAPTSVPTVEPTAVPTEVPAESPTEAAEEIVQPAEETAAEGTQTPLQQANKAIMELEAVGENMDTSLAYIVLDTSGKTVWKIPLAGMEFEVPDFIYDAHGGIRAMGGLEMIPETGIVELSVYYYSITEAKYYDLIKKLADYADDTEDIDEISGYSRRYFETAYELDRHRHLLFSIWGIGNNQGVDEILAADKKDKEDSGFYTEEELAAPDTRTFTKIGSAEDYNFFFVQEPLDEKDITDLAADGKQFKAEYETLFNAMNQIAACFTFSRPIGVRELVAEGTALSFETLDIHGSPVKSDDIFSGHKATMLNIWATTSTASISEMPELMQLNRELGEKGGQIVGLIYDADEPDLITEAKAITEELKIDFLTLLPNDYLIGTFDAMSYPISYFINEKGEIMGEPLMGAGINSYRDRMAEYLGE